MSAGLSRAADTLLRNPVWHALRTEHAALAIGGQQALRYPAAYIPFAGLATPGQEALDQLHSLLAPGESIYLATEEALPACAGFDILVEIPGLQMVYAASPATGFLREETGPEPEPLTAADVPEMLALKEIAFPGYYGPRAPSLGSYYGIRVEGRLVAMAGERLALPGLREVSAVCTHPAHTGKGYAARLIRQLVEDELASGWAPFLHLAEANTRALALYERIGFVRSRKIWFMHVQRA